MIVFYKFIDHSLNELLRESQEVFPDLSMEVRMDADLVYDKNGKPFYYDHADQYLCGNADYTAIVYGIPMGFENKGEKVSAEEALRHTESVISAVHRHNLNKPLYIDQFLFFDNTPKFSHNAQLAENEIELYLNKVSDILLKHTRGYGIWTYKNYKNNMLYNSQFALLERGWNTKGDPIFTYKYGSKVCILNERDQISQIIPETRNTIPDDHYFVSFEVKNHENNTKIRIHLGNIEKELSINYNGNFELVMNKNSGLDLCIKVISGGLAIDNINLYSFIQDGKLYDTDNTELDIADDIRSLNEKLQ